MWCCAALDTTTIATTAVYQMQIKFNRRTNNPETKYEKKLQQQQI